MLAAARDAFAEFGTDASLEDIARQANVGIGTLYRNFPTRQDLLEAVYAGEVDELCVAARKFRNLHVFGCWWFLNNPSIIEEITRMRLELLGMSVTPQHSDCRVLDQLVYKWQHSRGILANVLADKYEDLAATGWEPARTEIERDVRDLFGGALERFLKSFIWGVRPGDPITLAAVGLGLLLATALASLIPASRISRLNPADTLRSE